MDSAEILIVAGVVLPFATFSVLGLSVAVLGAHLEDAWLPFFLFAVIALALGLIAGGILILRRKGSKQRFLVLVRCSQPHRGSSAILVSRRRRAPRGARLGQLRQRRPRSTDARPSAPAHRPHGHAP
jgi:hypothetical protein